MTSEVSLVELCREMAAAWRTAPAPAPVHLEEVTRSGLAAVEALGVAYGWTCRVVRTGEAVLRLHKDGFEEEAAPLVRSMIEHVIGLHWIQDMPGDAFQALVRQRQHEIKKLQAAEQHGWSVTDKARDLMKEILEVSTDEETRHVDSLAHVNHQALRYGLGAYYQAWLVETWSSHASYVSATAYLSYDDDGTELCLLGEPKPSQRETVMSVAIMTYAAIDIYRSFLPAGALAELVTDWAQRLGLVGEGETGGT